MQLFRFEKFWIGEHKGPFDYGVRYLFGPDRHCQAGKKQFLRRSVPTNDQARRIGEVNGSRSRCTPHGDGCAKDLDETAEVDGMKNQEP